MGATLKLHDASTTTATLHDFEIEGKLGAGGNASVHRARVKRTGEVVALKTIHGELTQDPKYLARFQREVRAASQVHHPNVCQLLSWGEDGGKLFLAMELIEGGSLADLIERAGRLPAPVAALLVADLLAALGAAHELGILHRDVKPANAMVTRDGVLKLVDFGIAKGQADARVTETGFLVGTPAYMSPEMAVGREIDLRADLYAVGVSLYEMLLGQNPYADDAPSRALLRIASEPMPSVFESDPTVPGILELVLERLVERDVGLRYPTAAAALSDLEPYLAFLRSLYPTLLQDFVRDPAAIAASLAAEQAALEAARAERLLLAGDVNLPSAALALYRAKLLSPEYTDRFVVVCGRGGFRFGDVDDDALVAARRALAESPNPAGPLKRLADLYRARGDIHRAAVFMRRYLRERPSDSHARHQLETWVVGQPTPTLTPQGKLQTADILAGIRTGGWAAVEPARKELALALTQPKPSVASASARALPAHARTEFFERAPAPASTSTSTSKSPRPAVVATMMRADEASLSSAASSFWESHGRRMVVAGGFLCALGAVIFLFARVVDVSVASTQRVLSDNQAGVGQIEEANILRKQENTLKNAIEYENADDCNRAVVEVTRLLTLRPPGRIALDGLLVRGRCRYRLGQADAGRKDLEEFLAQSPLSDARRVHAQQLLEGAGRL
jgi:hypothetical protein